MATKAQLKANKENAQKSTGPRTPEGKRAVSQNALKHGLFAQEAVIYGESQAEYEMRREAFLAEWQPVGPTESMLAERIVSLSWRLLRAERIQNQTMDCMILREVVGQPDDQLDRSYRKAYGVSPDDRADSDEYLPLGRITVRWMDNSKLIERLFMHERRIESSLERTMTYLKKIQIMRRIERDAAAERSASQADAPCRGRPARACRGHLARDMAPQSESDSRAAGPESPVGSPPAHDHNGNFAKQSQFVPALADIKPFQINDYGNMDPTVAGRNKANPQQIGERTGPDSRGFEPNPRLPAAATAVMTGLAGA